MPVLVTGANGFIGKRLVSRLRADGDDVRAFVLPGESVEALDGAVIVRGDVTDRDAVLRATEGVTCIYHLAAIVGDWGDENRYVAVNVGGTRNILDGAVRASVERVLMVSSIVVYGWQLHTKICDERNTAREYGVSPYSRTKRASEELALDYDAFGRVPVTVVRPGNVYGAGSDVWVDQLVEILRSGQGILIDGGGGDAVLAHVDNVVDVIVRAARTPEAAGRIYNANDGGGVTWGQYLGDIAQLARLAPPRRTVSSSLAMALAVGMEQTWRVLRRRTRPLLTREAVTLLASREPVPIDRAADDLGYTPPVDYDQALHEIAEYLTLQGEAA